MPKRTEQHEIDRLAMNKLDGLIPVEWPRRRLDDDYGLDYNVEIFENGEPTGHMFFIQLKGTKKSIENDSISYQMKTDTLNYYKKLTLPVLLVVIQVEENIAWGKWVNNVEFPLNQQYKSIQFNIDSVLTSNRFKEMASKFHFDVSNRIKLEIITSDCDKSKQYGRLVAEAIYTHYGNKVAIENQYSNQILTINIRNCKDDLELQIKFRDIEYSESVLINDKAVFLYLPYNQDYLIEELVKPLHVISLLLLQYYLLESYELFKKTFTRYDGELETIENYMQVSKALLESDEFHRYQELIILLLKDNKYELFELFNMFLLPYTSKSIFISDCYIKNLNSYINMIDDDNKRAMVSYNIANYYRSKGEFKYAIKYYREAKKYDNTYKDRAYFLKETAGVLYLLKRYKLSELFYKKAKSKIVDTKEICFVDGLIADTLFYQRKFSEAIKHYQMSFGDKSDEVWEIKLRIWVSRYINKIYLEDTYDNLKSIDLIRGVENLLPYKAEKILEEALKYDVLNSVTWFNIAHVYNIQDKREQSRNAYLVCAIINQETEALTLSILQTFNLVMFNGEMKGENLELLIIQLNYLNAKWGITAVNGLLEKFVLDQGGTTEENLQGLNLLKDFINSILTSY